MKFTPFSSCAANSCLQYFVHHSTWIIALTQRNPFRLGSSQIHIFSFKDFELHFLVKDLPYFLMMPL